MAGSRPICCGLRLASAQRLRLSDSPPSTRPRTIRQRLLRLPCLISAHKSSSRPPPSAGSLTPTSSSNTGRRPTEPQQPSSLKLWPPLLKEEEDQEREPTCSSLHASIFCDALLTVSIDRSVDSIRNGGHASYY